MGIETSTYLSVADPLEALATVLLGCFVYNKVVNMLATVGVCKHTGSGFHVRVGQGTPVGCLRYFKLTCQPQSTKTRS